MVLFAFLSLVVLIISTVMPLLDSSFISLRLLCWLLLLTSKRSSELTAVLVLIHSEINELALLAVGVTTICIAWEEVSSMYLTCIISCLLCVRIKKLALDLPQNNLALIYSGLVSRTKPSLVFGLLFQV